MAHLASEDDSEEEQIVAVMEAIRYGVQTRCPSAPGRIITYALANCLCLLAKQAPIEEHAKTFEMISAVIAKSRQESAPTLN